MTPRAIRDAANGPWERDPESLSDQERLELMLSHPDPVNMPHEYVGCWECGMSRRNPRWTHGLGRDEYGHAYCLAHRWMWGSPRP